MGTKAGCMIRWTSVLFVAFLMTDKQVCSGKKVVAHAALEGKAPAFGHELKPLFLIDDDYLNLNHGSFGACPRPVLDAQRNYVAMQEGRPDVWFRDQMYKLMTDSRELVAEYVKASSSDDLVFVENASGAVNSILRSLPKLAAGDIFLYFSVAYGMVKNTAIWMAKEFGVKIIEVPIKFPISEGHEESAFLAPMKETLDGMSSAELSGLRMVILDHIASVPAVIEPIAKLAKMIKAKAPDTQILVDGAHAMGQLENLDISTLGPIDYYLSNGHKWLYSPRGSAFLWVSKSRQTSLTPQPTVVSSENAPGTPFTERYSYTGTRDYTSFVAMRDAMAFRHWLGGDAAVCGYVQTLAQEANQLLVNMWNTSRLVPAGSEAMMTHVVLPTNDFKIAQTLQKVLLDQDSIYFIVLQTDSGVVYTRLSAQVYLDISDFSRFGHRVLQFLSDHSNNILN